MPERRVAVFFYGSFINLDVLRQVDIVPERVEIAKLPGWEIRIERLATLKPDKEQVVHGIVVDCTHTELERLYGQDWVGTYLPEAVLVETDEGKSVPALTFIKWDYQVSPASTDYVERISKPARDYGFPDWYIDRIRSFAPAS